jgi:hypothetical protein
MACSAWGSTCRPFGTMRARTRPRPGCSNFLTFPRSSGLSCLLMRQNVDTNRIRPTVPDHSRRAHAIGHGGQKPAPRPALLHLWNRGFLARRHIRPIRSCRQPRSITEVIYHRVHMSKIRRRDLLAGVTTAGVAATLGTTTPAPAASRQLAARRDKRRPQYQADSPEVQTFYRVNRYPAK